MSKLILEIEFGDQTAIAQGIKTLNSMMADTMFEGVTAEMPNEPAEMIMADIARENNVPEQYPNPEQTFTEQAPTPVAPVAPTEQAPTPVAPVAPTEQAPVPVAPVAPTEQAPVPVAPPTPTEQAPTPVAPPTPTEQAPVPVAPTEQAPTPVAPVAPTEQAPVPVAPTEQAPATELDSAGQPWDARIHAGTKSKIKDGTWKIKRGTDESLIAQVRAENAATVTEPTPPAPTEPAPVAPPTPPTPTEQAPATGSTTVSTLAELQTALKAKGTQMSEILRACQNNGVAAFPLLATQPAAVIQAVAIELGV